MKKKLLTLFLAFAIMMTFMPSMAFADVLNEVNVNFILQESEDGLICDLVADNSLETTFQCMFYDRDGNMICLFEAETPGEAGTWWIDSEDGPQLLSMEKALELFDIMDHVVLSGTVEPPVEGFEANGTVVETYLNGKSYTSNRTDYTVPVSQPTEEYPIIAKIDEDGNINVVVYYIIPHGNSLLEKILKGAAIAAGAAAVVGVVGTVVKNVQKAAVAQQMAFQAKMQQQMVQKQVASIKSVLKGAGVVLSLASFGSSLGKLFQLNQFGFNTFGFNQFGFR